MAAGKHVALKASARERPPRRDRIRREGGVVRSSADLHLAAEGRPAFRRGGEGVRPGGGDALRDDVGENPPGGDGGAEAGGISGCVSIIVADAWPLRASRTTRQWPSITPEPTPSFWLANMPPTLIPQAASMPPATCDIAIVGAGMTGCALAYWLQRLRDEEGFVVRHFAGEHGQNGWRRASEAAAASGHACGMPSGWQRGRVPKGRRRSATAHHVA